MGLLCFLFFVGPWLALVAWVWHETGGLAVSRRALLGTAGPDDDRRGPMTGPSSAGTMGSPDLRN